MKIVLAIAIRQIHIIVIAFVLLKYKSIVQAIPCLLLPCLGQTRTKLYTLFWTDGEKPYPVQRHIPV